MEKGGAEASYPLSVIQLNHVNSNARRESFNKE